MTTNAMKTLSYHNKPELKAKAVAMARHHRGDGMLFDGSYGEIHGGLFKGCSVGCDAYDILGYPELESPHKITAEYFGFPEWLEHLRDILFENLTEADRLHFHVDLKEAIPVGVDLEPVKHMLTIRRMDRLIYLLNADTEHDSPEVIASLEIVKRCAEAEISGDECDWAEAAEAAISAAMSAKGTAESVEKSADSAKEVAIPEACSSGSPASAAWSAESASWAAAESASWAAAAAAFKQERDDLFEILAGMESTTNILSTQELAK